MKMIQVTLQGKKLEADLLNPEVAKRYEEGFHRTVSEFNAAKGSVTGAEGIERQCRAVIDYVDDMFGAGSSEKVLGRETDLLTCLDTLEEMADLYDKQVAPLVADKSKEVRDKIFPASGSDA